MFFMCKKIHPKRMVELSKHHLLPKTRKQKNTHEPRNILLLWRDKHNAWHAIFKIYTLGEIISNWQKFKICHKSKYWKCLFKDLNFIEARLLLIRMKRRKNFACGILVIKKRAA